MKLEYFPFLDKYICLQNWLIKELTLLHSSVFLKLWNLQQRREITILLVFQSKLPSNNLLQLSSSLFRNCMIRMTDRMRPLAMAHRPAYGGTWISWWRRVQAELTTLNPTRGEAGSRHHRRARVHATLPDGGWHTKPSSPSTMKCPTLLSKGEESSLKCMVFRI
jgi:hypothetical protein